MKREFILSSWVHGILFLLLLLVTWIYPYFKKTIYQVNKVNLVSLPQSVETPKVVPQTVKPKPKVKKKVKTPKKTTKKKKKKKTKPKKTSSPKPRFVEPKKSLKERLKERMNQVKPDNTFVEPVLSKNAPQTRILTTEVFPHQWYLGILRSKISSGWEVSNLKSLAHQNIVAQCAFVILKNGQVNNVRISKSSGYSIFDESVVSAVEYASPFPPLPDEYGQNKLNLKIVFELD